MKRKIALMLVLLLALSVVGLAACDTTHTHNLQHVAEVAATCTAEGNSEYWHCADCNKYFADQEATKEIQLSDTVLPKGHALQHKLLKLATCTEDGNVDCWYCEGCGKYFADTTTTTVIDAESVVLTHTGHDEDTTTWQRDDTNHWHSCNNARCTAKLSVAEHTFDDGVDFDETKSLFTCTDCGFQVKRDYAKGTISGKLSCDAVTDFSSFVITLSNDKYSYTFDNIVAKDGSYSFEGRVGKGYKVLVVSRNGFVGASNGTFDIAKQNNAEQNIAVKQGVVIGDVTVNGKLVKTYGNLTPALIEDCLADGIVSVDSSTVSNIVSPTWSDRRLYLLPIASQVKKGTFNFNATVKSSLGYGYAGIGITDGTHILILETTTQPELENGLCIRFGTYTDDGWSMPFAMTVNCGGIDAQTPQNYQTRFSVRRYEDFFKLYIGDVFFATLSAKDGLVMQGNYKMINSPMFLKQMCGAQLEAFMDNTNEYAFLYTSNQGLACQMNYQGDFNARYSDVSGKISLPDGVTANLEDTRLIVKDGNKYSTLTDVVDAEGNFALEMACGTYDITFTHHAMLATELNNVEISDGTTELNATLEKKAISSSSAVLNNQEIKFGADEDEPSNVTIRGKETKNIFLGNSAYNGVAKFGATVNANNVTPAAAGQYEPLIAIGLTDGESMMRISMRNKYVNQVEFEYLLVSSDKTGFWVSNYRSYMLQASFLPSFDNGSTNGDLNFYFNKKADGSVDVYYEEYLLVSVKADGFFVGEGITTPHHVLNEQRRLPDAVAAWPCPAQPETAFMSTNREFAVWGCYESASEGGTIGFKSNVAVEETVETVDVKAQALKAKLAGKYLSLLGDSITTWNGISNSNANNSTISTESNACYPYYDVDKLEEVYWYQLIQNTGLNLLVNNSIGGSRAYGSENDAGAACNFRCENLHADKGELAGTNPDIIIVYIGINDVGASDETAEQFAIGYEKILSKITAKYPDADVFAVDLPYPGTSPYFHVYNLEKFNKVNQSINSIAEAHGVNLIHFRNSIVDDAANLTCDMLHPNVEGMKMYYQVIRDALYDFYCAE